MIQCKTCGVPEYCLEYLPREAQWHCPLCDSRTPDDRRVPRRQQPDSEFSGLERRATPSR